MSQTPPSQPPMPSNNDYSSPTPSYGARPGGAYSPVQEPRYNVLSIVSFVAAFFFSLVAVITGHIALGQIKRTGEKGRLLAIWGLVLGYVGIVTGVIAIVAFVVASVLGISLLGALASQYDPDDYSSTSDPYDTDAPVAPDVSGGDITFSDGASLTSSSYVEFADPFLGSSDWTVKAADDGNGTRSYTDSSGLCSVEFHQGAIDSTLVVPGDDRATTDAMLASVLSSTPADLSKYLTDDTFAAGYSGDGSIADTRSLSSSNNSDGSSKVFAGRAFAGVPTGLYVVIDCASGGDIDAIYNEVKTSAAIIVS